MDNKELKLLFCEYIKPLSISNLNFNIFSEVFNTVSKQHQAKKSVINRLKNKDSTLDTLSELFIADFFIKKFGKLVEIEKETNKNKNCDLYIDLRKKGFDKYYIEIKTIHKAEREEQYDTIREKFLEEVRLIQSGYNIQISYSFGSFGSFDQKKFRDTINKILLRIRSTLLNYQEGQDKIFEYKITISSRKILNTSICKEVTLKVTIIKKIKNKLRTFISYTGGVPINHNGGHKRIKGKILDKLGEINKNGAINKETQFLSNQKNILLFMGLDYKLNIKNYINALNGTPLIEINESNGKINTLVTGNAKDGISNDSQKRDLNLSMIGIFQSLKLKTVYIQNNNTGNNTLKESEIKKLFGDKYRFLEQKIIKHGFSW